MSQQNAEIQVHQLLDGALVSVTDTDCKGTCLDLSCEEWTETTQLVFPYRGLYIRHVGRQETLADTNHVIFFNQHEAYRVSHPVRGGDGNLTLRLDESQLQEVTSGELLHRGSRLIFRRPSLQNDAHVQRLVALLRHRLRQPFTEALEAEVIALTLAQQALVASSGSQPPRRVLRSW